MFINQNKTINNAEAFARISVIAGYGVNLSNNRPQSDFYHILLYSFLMGKVSLGMQTVLPEEQVAPTIKHSHWPQMQTFLG